MTTNEFASTFPGTFKNIPTIRIRLFGIVQRNHPPFEMILVLYDINTTGVHMLKRVLEPLTTIQERSLIVLLRIAAYAFLEASRTFSKLLERGFRVRPLLRKRLG